MILKVKDIRSIFINKRIENEVAENGTLEIINANFIADEPTIFGNVNEEYAACELEWYKSCSLNIQDMPCKIPSLWKNVATREGYINSNYGWAIFSPANFHQYKHCIDSLKVHESTRQAVMIYIRPSMHTDAHKDGMKDFMCTFSTQLFIRNGLLHYIVYMRSNDAVFGYNNDKHWHEYVFACALKDLQEHYPNLKRGNMYWNAGSLHVYTRHFELVENSNG